MTHETMISIGMNIWHGINLILTSHLIYLVARNGRTDYLKAKQHDLSIDRSEGKR